MKVDSKAEIAYVCVDREKYDEITSAYGYWAEGEGGAVFCVDMTLNDAYENEDKEMSALLESAQCDEIVFYVGDV